MKQKLPYDRLSELQSEEHHMRVYKSEDNKDLPSGDESSDYILRIVFGKLLYRRPHCKGKNIILFDDVITSGRSMEQLRARLQKAGANVIGGFSIGKTKHE